MPETWAELAAQVLALGGEAEGKSTEELKRGIAKYFYDPKKHLPQLCPMLAYDSTMEFSERGEAFWEDYEGGWYAEPKIDEVRALLFFKDGKCRIQSRGRHKHTQLFHEMTDNFPWVQEFYSEELEGTILDGGLVAGLNVASPRNCWVGNDLLLMMSMVGSGPERSAEIQRGKGRPKFVVFDIVQYKQIPMSEPWRGYKSYPIKQRREYAERLVKTIIGGPDIFLIPQWYRDLKAHYDRVVETGGEGIMLKKRESFYAFKRSKDWLKVKRYEDIVGYAHSKHRDGNNAWKGLVGSINVADKDGKIIGAVGTMTLERRNELSDHGDLHHAFVGRPLMMRIYKKHTDSGNPRHARLVAWLDNEPWAMKIEETIKEESNEE